MDVENNQTLDAIINMVESPSNIARMREHEDQYNLVYGDLKKKITEEIQIRYPDSWQTMTVMALKIADKILRKLGRCYANGCKRVISDKEGRQNDELTELFEVVYSCMNSKNQSGTYILNRADKLFNLSGYIEMFAFIGKNGLINLKPMTQHLFTAIPDDEKENAAAIVFKHDKADWTITDKFIDWEHIPADWHGGEVEGIYTVWTPKKQISFSKISKLQEEGEQKGQTIFYIVKTYEEKNKKNINPFGILPFVAIKKECEGNFYPSVNEIASTAKDINIIISDIITIANQQGFGQAVVYYDTDEPPVINKSGPTHVITIPSANGNSRFEFANANPDLNGHLQVVLTVVRMLLTTNDLTTDKIAGELTATNFASAIDRLIADSESIENIDDQRDKYISIESKLFEIIKKQLIYMIDTNTWPKQYPVIKKELLESDEYSLSLYFNSSKPIITEKEHATTISYLEENGFILPHEKHLRFNDGMTEAQAREREEEIKAVKQERMEEAMQSQVEGVNNDITEEDDQLEGPGKKGFGKSKDPKKLDPKRQEINGKLGIGSNKKEDKKRNRSKA